MDILNRLRSLWGRIQASPHQCPGHEPRSQETQQTPQPVIRAELHIPQAVIERCEARQKEEDGDKTWKTRMDIGTLALGIAGFLVLAATLYETRRAVNVAVESYRWDKRAWVGIGNVNMLNKPTAEKPLSLRVDVRNSGESPAVHTFVVGYLSLIKKAPGDQQIISIDHPEFTPCVEPKPRWGQVIGGAVVVPGAETLNMTRTSQTLPGQFMELIKTPGATVDTAQWDIREIPTNRGTSPFTDSWEVGLYLVGCINYFDTFREAHRTSFCYRYFYDRTQEAALPNGTFIVCDRGNDAD